MVEEHAVNFSPQRFSNVKRYRIVTIFLLTAGITLSFTQTGLATPTKSRIMVVSSYHKEYLWTQETNKGVVAALLDFGYLDNKKQGQTYTRKDYVESSKVVVKKLWMDTKRKNSKNDIMQTVARIVKEIEEFKPDVILLGDDNAANHIGNQYIDTEIPIVFWGINHNPLKYDLVDSIDNPGHNITGVYQAGYLKEGVIWLKKLLPGVKTLAVLSDDSPTARPYAKALARFAKQGQLPVEIVETVVTNSLETWKAKALALQHKVDAFFVLNHNTLKDRNGKAVDQLEIGAWYLRNIKKPDIGHSKQFVIEGMFCAVDDSGIKQGYEAVKIAHRILEGGEDPGTIPVYAPERGPIVVNLERSAMLGILDLVKASPLIDELIEKALALEKYP